MSLHDERKQWEQEALAEPLPEQIEITAEIIAGVDCVWVKEKYTHSKNIIIYLHGGGLVAGSALTHQHFAASIVSACGSCVLLVNYRLLPEHKYPAPLDDILLVYDAIVSDGIYASHQIVIGGDSSGGGLALAALVQLRDSNSPMPKCSFTVSGAFDMTLSNDCMQNNNCVDPHLSRDALVKWQQDYLEYDLKSPLLSPLYSSLSGLPPLLLLAGGQEPWVCDSKNVARKIREGGGVALLKIWSHMGHVWMMDSALNESQEALHDISEFINKDYSII